MAIDLTSLSLAPYIPPITLKDDGITKVLPEREKYLYHSVGGFNLDKLTSILALGILSKKEGNASGINIQSEGMAFNGNQWVSVATYEVLDRGSYSGLDVGLVINPAGLYIKPTYTMDEGAPFYERQVLDKVPRKNIVGITVPPKYMQEDFSETTLFYVPNTKDVKQGMDSLEKFYQRTTGISLLADEKLKVAFDRALSLPEEERRIKETRPCVDAFIEIDTLSNKRQKEFDFALISRIKNVYREITKKDTFTLVDIVRFHTNDEVPIYLTTDKLDRKPVGISSKFSKSDMSEHKEFGSEIVPPKRSDVRMGSDSLDARLSGLPDINEILRELRAARKQG